MANAGQQPASSGLPHGVALTAGIVRDNIFITDNVTLRTIAVSTFIPPTMARQDWRVDDFDLHKELYRGKTSLLYSATDRRSGIPVALKLYRKRKLSTLNKYQVEREIRIHIQLDHVNIVKLYAAFEDEKNVYMVQEFAGGGDLFEDLKRSGGSIKEKYVVRDIIMPFLNALQYLHGLGIIHRDIKPENILLSNQRVIKIADFGLSINYLQERPVTRAGTLDYMAPEVLICPDKRRPEENKDKILLAYTAQVDAWAVGILCYELLVGYPPFEQESRAATYEYIMYKEPRFPGWMSDDAKKFITLALCKNASQRPTIRDLGQQPLILTYAKPVEKPAEQRLPQEFLVERSPRSVVGSPQVSSPVSKLPAPPHTLSPLPPRRPVALTCATDEGGVASGSGDEGPSTPTRLQPMSRQGSTASSVLVDEDASYAISEFATPDDGQNASAAGGTAGKHLPSGMVRGNSLPRMPGSPMIKSRLGVSNGGGVSPTATPTPPPHSPLPQNVLAQAHGKLLPVSLLARPGTLSSNGGTATWDSTAGEAGDTSQSGAASPMYSRPQDGVLSDDSHLPGTVGQGSSSSAGQGFALIKVPGQGTAGGLVERPQLEGLLAAGGSPQGQDGQGQGDDPSSSKYSSLFSKMWGKKGPGADAAPSKASGDTPLAKLGSPTGARPLKAAALRNLQDEFLTERADSITITDRNGSVVGAPSMNFKAKPATTTAGRAPGPAPGASGSAGDRAGLDAIKAFAINLQDELGGGPQRMNSEAMLARLAVPAAAGSARSFTSANSPAMRKLANAPIVNKIHEYVQSHPAETSNRGGAAARKS